MRIWKSIEIATAHVNCCIAIPLWVARQEAETRFVAGADANGLEVADVRLPRMSALLETGCLRVRVTEEERQWKERGRYPLVAGWR